MKTPMIELFTRPEVPTYSYFKPTEERQMGLSSEQLAALVLKMVVDTMDTRKPAVAKITAMDREFVMTIARAPKKKAVAKKAARRKSS